MDFDPNVYFNFWGFFLMEIMNIRMLENIGLIIKAYNKLLYAINLNSLSLNNSAFGTMLAEAKNKLKDNK